MKIGLEIHVALPTKSKLFCRCSTDTSKEPNVNICPTCTGLPGSRPLLNSEAVRIAKSIASVLNCKIKNPISFIRKVYFYPDLPKSFQITQLSDSIGSDGYLQLETKRIGIMRVQIEEDPAKLVRKEDYSLIDFNRSGMPLVEIVTSPDIKNLDELREAVFYLRSILYYQGVDIAQEIKADLNISMDGDRVEIKNITGIKNLVDAAEYEMKRQTELLLSGKTPQKETRAYDETNRITRSLRKKESEEEYGFIYEPDLANYEIEKMQINEIVIPSETAKELGKRYDYSYKTIMDIVAFDREVLSLIEATAGRYPFRVIIDTLESVEKSHVAPISIADFEKLMKISTEGIELTKGVIKDVLLGKETGPRITSDAEIEEAIKKIIRSDPSLLQRYTENKNVLNFIIGRIAKEYRLQPKDVSKRLEDVVRDMLGH